MSENRQVNTPNPEKCPLIFKVIALDTTAKVVKTSKGNEFRYDILVLATGSIADLPPYISAQRAREIKGKRLSSGLH
jgi:NAD(P)H-nitrite reductase large subunit